MKLVKAQILTDNHTHENRPVAKGDVIELPEDIAKILFDAEPKIAEPAKATAPKGE